jgi:hypothetical protein
MFVFGTQKSGQGKLIHIDYPGLLHHTLIVGQSGSGKSFFVARLLEEILLRSRSRVLIVDPNGDFRKLSWRKDSIWKDLESKFQALQKKFDALQKSNPDVDHKKFDQKDDFNAAWGKRRFIYLNPGSLPPKPPKIGTANEIHKKLIVHWDSLDEDLQRFLLSADPSREPKIALGLETILETARCQAETKEELPFGIDLRVLQGIVQEYALRNMDLKQYESIKTLTADDWYAVLAKISHVLDSYAIWWSRVTKRDTKNPTSANVTLENITSARPPGLSDFIDGGFERDRALESYWDALVLSLDASNQADTLLAVEVALSRLWAIAKVAWRNKADQVSQKGAKPDERVPTFVVIDEAHNFAPKRSSNPLQDKVTSRLVQIASEGRKYGLYLILATQRPTKLHEELVPECENTCLLRVQADYELDYACNKLGYEKSKIDQVKTFEQGVGYFNGRWVDNPTVTDIAPARTIVGGGGLGEDWKKLPDPTPSAVDPMNAIKNFVGAQLRDSTEAIPLATLSNALIDKFDVLRPGDDWLGHTFKKLLSSLGIEGLQFSEGSPGLAYLEGKHPVPVPVQGASASTVKQANNIPPAVSGIIQWAHDVLGLPVLPPERFRSILEKISDEVQDGEVDHNIISKAVRDKINRQGPETGRSAIDFVLRGIRLSGHHFDLDLPQTSDALAEAFSNSVIDGLKKKGDVVDPAKTSELREYLSGGLLRETPSKGIDE